MSLEQADLRIVADTMVEMRAKIEELTGARHSMYDGAVGIAKDLAAAPAPTVSGGEGWEELVAELEGKLRKIEATEQFPLSNAPRPEDAICFRGGRPQEIAAEALALIAVARGDAFQAATRPSIPTVQAETAVVGISHLNAEQQADIRAHVAGLSDPETETYEAPVHGWSCFHCGQNFKTARGARLHFGQSPEGRTSCAEPERLLADYDDAIMSAHNASPVRVGYESKMARVTEARGSILRALAPVSTGEQPGMEAEGRNETPAERRYRKRTLAARQNRAGETT